MLRMSQFMDDGEDQGVVSILDLFERERERRCVCVCVGVAQLVQRMGLTTNDFSVSLLPWLL